jgi:hypothetical protein
MSIVGRGPIQLAMTRHSWSGAGSKARAPSSTEAPKPRPAQKAHPASRVDDLEAARERGKIIPSGEGFLGRSGWVPRRAE